VSRNHSRSGSLASEAYPSGRVVNTCYDLANRVTQTGLATCASGTTPTYASQVTYAVHGAPTQMVMGNNVWHEPSYNNRLQMSGFADLVNGSTSTPYLNVALNWGTTQNNGNLIGGAYTHTGGPGLTGSPSFTQAYYYDGVNRLTSLIDQAEWIASGRTGIAPAALAAFGNATHTIAITQNGACHRPGATAPSNPWSCLAQLSHHQSQKLKISFSNPHNHLPPVF
jgi:hypothetical protein